MASQNTFIPTAAQQPAQATAAVCTMPIPTDTLQRWKIRSINWNYTAAPTGGLLSIAYGSVTETYNIAAAGPGSLTWATPRAFLTGSGVTVTLASGGGSVVGEVFVDAYTAIG